MRCSCEWLPVPSFSEIHHPASHPGLRWQKRLFAAVKKRRSVGCWKRVSCSVQVNVGSANQELSVAVELSLQTMRMRML
jgi:hypothetical protein